jgi:hypothetical protein
MLPALVELYQLNIATIHDAIRKAEAQEVTAVESCMTLSNLKDKLNSRKKEENFIRVSRGTNVFLRRR